MSPDHKESERFTRIMLFLMALTFIFVCVLANNLTAQECVDNNVGQEECWLAETKTATPETVVVVETESTGVDALWAAILVTSYVCAVFLLAYIYHNFNKEI